MSIVITEEEFVQSYHANGRTAFAEGLKHLDFPIGSVILVPDPICEDAILPVYEAGLTCISYQLNSNLEAKLPELRQKIFDLKPKAVLAVNYFDQCKNMHKIRDICENLKIAMIEDNCHGFEIDVKNNGFFQYGTIMFSAPRKIKKLPTGGFLSVRRKLFSSNVTKKTVYDFKFLPAFKGMIKFFILNHSFQLTKISRSMMKVKKFSTQPSINIPLKKNQLIDAFSLRVLRATSRESEVLKRKSHWEQWEEIFKSLDWKIEPVFSEYKNGSCPWAYPFYVTEDKKNIFIHLRKKYGVPLFIWPDDPILLDEKRIFSGSQNVRKISCIDLLHAPDWYFGNENLIDYVR